MSKINLSPTYEEGDKVLKAVAPILKEEFEEVGVASRYDGGEMELLVDDPH